MATYDNSSWNVQSLPKDSIPKMQGNFEALKDNRIVDAGKLQGKTLSDVMTDVGNTGHTAGQIANTPAGNISATTVQAAINELDAEKAPRDNPVFTGNVTLPTTTSVGNVSSTELGYLDGVTSGIQGQLNGKAPTASPVFTDTLTINGTRTVSIMPSIGSMSMKGSTGGWDMGYRFDKYTDGASLGGFAAFGSTDTVFYYYIGAHYTTPIAVFKPSGRIGLGGITEPQATLHSTGSTIYGVATTAVPDANIGNGQCNVWLNESTNQLTFRVRYSTGIYKTATLALT